MQSSAKKMQSWSVHVFFFFFFLSYRNTVYAHLNCFPKLLQFWPVLCLRNWTKQQSYCTVLWRKLYVQLSVKLKNAFCTLQCHKYAKDRIIAPWKIKSLERHGNTAPSSTSIYDLFKSFLVHTELEFFFHFVVLLPSDSNISHHRSSPSDDTLFKKSATGKIEVLFDGLSK